MGGVRDVQASSGGLIEDLFRNEHAHLVAALTRILGTSNVALAEDVVQDALVSAMHAWRFGPPRDPKAGISSKGCCWLPSVRRGCARSYWKQ